MSNQKNNQTLDVNESLAKTEAFFIKYKKQVITAVVVVLVIAGGIPAYIFGYSKPREEKAQECLGIVMQKYLMSQDYEHALKGEGKTLGLTKIADKYSSTNAGNIAKYEAGICNIQLGKTKEAITVGERIPRGQEQQLGDDHEHDDPLREPQLPQHLGGRQQGERIEPDDSCPGDREGDPGVRVQRDREHERREAEQLRPGGGAVQGAVSRPVQRDHANSRR